MRVLLFHGYFLRGTGSNIYTASLAEALARLGHEVHLVCQERGVRLEGVEVHTPDIGGLLPVYVKDPYEGFEVKAYPEMTDEELDRYLDVNVSAVRDLAAGGIDAALGGHLVMGPAILARAGIESFAAKVHGSALEYTVKPHPRFLPYAEEGMRAANGVLVGSRHTADSLWSALPNVTGLREKTRLGPPGVDTDLFKPPSSSSHATPPPPAGGAVGGTAPEEASATGRGGGSPAATGPAAGALVIYLCAAGACSLLALANAPVGPTSYSPKLTEMRPLLAADSTLVFASKHLLEEEQGVPYLAWELRGGRVCIESEGEAANRPPPGVRFVITEGADGDPPFPGLTPARRAGPYLLWEREGTVGGPSPCPLIAVRQARQGP